MKTVLITGGSRGIGRAMVELFSQKGYSVAFTYKSSDSLAKELAEKTGAFAVRADSSVEKEVLCAVCSVKERLGDIEILINNAAVSRFSLFQETSLEEWRDTFSVNVDGAFLYTKALLPDMIKNLPHGSPWGR